MQGDFCQFLPKSLLSEVVGKGRKETLILHLSLEREREKVIKIKGCFKGRKILEWDFCPSYISFSLTHSMTSVEEGK